ncbi:hypothetical protein [Lysobacter xanthus]
MKFRIPDAAAVDLADFGDRLLDADPAALLDRDPRDGALRLVTCLEPVEIVPLLDAAGLSVAPSRVERLPSECCGGCGG